jgi:hypothetical protein
VSRGCAAGVAAFVFGLCASAGGCKHAADTLAVACRDNDAAGCRPPEDAGSSTNHDSAEAGTSDGGPEADAPEPSADGGVCADGGCRGVCRAHRYRAVRSTPVTGNGASPPACLADQGGALELSYTAGRCSEPRAFRGCQVSEMADLTAFEAGEGVWQVEVCVDRPLIDTINLWYEVPSMRKYMNLLRPGAAAGCHVLFLAPSDACLSADACGPLCAGGGRTAGGDAGNPSTDAASATGDAAAEELDAMTEGRDATPEDGATYDAGYCPAFSQASLTLMSEWCVCPTGGCPESSEGHVRLASMTYFSSGCLCQRDADCDAGTVCRRDAWPSEAHCRATASGCPGICAP